MELNIGDFFPDFTLKDENTQDFNLKNDFKNNYLVIYFYPKDETPGCTKQACYFKEFYDEFQKSYSKTSYPGKQRLFQLNTLKDLFLNSYFQLLKLEFFWRIF